MKNNYVRIRQMKKLSNLQQSSKKFYSKRIKKYDQIRQWVEEDIKFKRLDNQQTFIWHDIVESVMKICPPPKKFLDLGCGPGARDAVYLQKAGYDSTAADVLPKIIQDVRKTHPELKTILVDINKNLPFENNRFDLIFSIAVIQHVDKKSVFEKMFPEVKRILKKDGFFLLWFKEGQGIKNIYDSTYKLERLFQLYEAKETKKELKEIGFHFLKKGKFKKPILFLDNRKIKTCLILVRK